jgi:hypothetical protein
MGMHALPEKVISSQKREQKGKEQMIYKTIRKYFLKNGSSKSLNLPLNSIIP